MQTNKVARAKARESGAKFYCTGLLCINGHDSERRTSTGQCLECVRQNNRAWATANPSRVYERNQAFYQANAGREKARAQAHRLANPEQSKLSALAWRQSNAERRKAVKRAYRAGNPDKVKAARRAAYEANREDELAKAREWKKKNPDKTAALNAKRQAAKILAIPAWADLSAVDAIYESARLRSAAEGIEYHADHIVPLVSKIVCGFHCEANLRVITGAENQAKSNRVWPDMPD